MRMDLWIHQPDRSRPASTDTRRRPRCLPPLHRFRQVAPSRMYSYARTNGLSVVATIKEKGSAKTPHKRDEFTKILKEIEDGGKYDAILSYAPDRLSRNMLEGGLIINLLDEGKLKDLQFPTHHFTNDPSGKLTLGIMFSISKHFSDDLSRKVRRGV